MYIYLEKKFFISHLDIISILDYRHFLDRASGKEYLKNNKKKIIDLSVKTPKTAVITDEYIYLTGNEIRSLFSRGMEYDRITKNSKKVFGGKNE